MLNSLADPRFAGARVLFSSRIFFFFFFINSALSVGRQKERESFCCHYRAQRQTRPTRIPCETIETNRVRAWR